MLTILEKLKQKYHFNTGAGFVETVLPSVRFFWSTEAVARAPLIYNAGLVFILQGYKTGWLKDSVFHYSPNHYLLLSAPISFECETFATQEQPLLGLFIDIDRIALHDQIRLLNEKSVHPKKYELGVKPVAIDDDMQSIILRLMKTLCSDISSKAFGSGILQELLFYVLTGPHGQTLQLLAQKDSHFEKILKSINHIRENYSEPLSIEYLAKIARMSVSVFYRAFKTIMGISPHQYLKSIRLHRAKGFIVTDGLPVSDAAQRVGYNNPSHFSREFKKMFNVSPKFAQTSGYTPIDL